MRKEKYFKQKSLHGVFCSVKIMHLEKHHIFKLVCSSMNLLKIIVKICYLPSNIIDLFHDGGRYHIETSPLICRKSMDWFVYDNGLRHERFKDFLSKCYHICSFLWIPVVTFTEEILNGKSHFFVQWQLTSETEIPHFQISHWRIIRKAMGQQVL